MKRYVIKMGAGPKMAVSVIPRWNIYPGQQPNAFEATVLSFQLHQ
jgi:hypothetical protein